MHTFNLDSELRTDFIHDVSSAHFVNTAIIAHHVTDGQRRVGVSRLDGRALADSQLGTVTAPAHPRGRDARDVDADEKCISAL